MQTSNKKTNFRWVIVTLLFYSTTIVYFDRVILGILAPFITEEIGWSEQEYGYVVFAFQLTYAIGPLFIGYVIDRLGTRWGFSLAVIVWAFFSLSHAAARSWLGFAIARLGLGIGQSANFPASIKTVAEWFPQKERAYATGVFNGGSNIGQVAAPLLIPVVLYFFTSWRYVFVLSLVLSAVWLVLWLIFFKSPRESRFVNDAEREYIRSDSGDLEKVKVPWKKLVKYRQTWVVALGKLFADPVWYFYLFWGAKFLNARFGVELKGLALPLIVIYVLAWGGGMAGGAVSSFLLKKGKSPNFARKITMVGTALLVLPVMIVPFVDSLPVCVGLIALAAAAHNSWSANIFTIASDLFPKKIVGSVIGFSTTVSSIAAMGTALLIGYALNESGVDGYVFPFVIAAFGYLVGILVIHLLSPGMKPVSINK
ncbi:MFS transporter [Mariniphaga sediminis]|uniref:MFS transporter n=1 Tax=Mariniphaga sediminis TaxID=1628158 RepID=A0A399D0L6_9BACT|nr:MFS transporter [Mariniphaga sediminis]RIH64272.1 MFS transporter [Mariniphaga sediminis]RIH66551.1 MFS transporter [Mariniphaga sediminis]